MMNFDCTILLSFEHSSKIPPYINFNDKIKELDITVIKDEKIQPIKKEYFNKTENEYFIEFFNPDFIGFITEDWVVPNNPPKEISIFIESITELILDNQLKNTKLYISRFTEKGLTEDFFTSSSLETLIDKLFFMSNAYYDVLCDNLIIEITSA